jgi:hypothetical protein
MLGAGGSVGATGLLITGLTGFWPPEADGDAMADLQRDLRPIGWSKVVSAAARDCERLDFRSARPPIEVPRVLYEQCRHVAIETDDMASVNTLIIRREM